MKRLIKNHQKIVQGVTGTGYGPSIQAHSGKGPVHERGREMKIMKRPHIILALTFFFIAQMTAQTLGETMASWSFDELTAWGEAPEGWADASSAGSAHTYQNTTFAESTNAVSRSCLHIKTTGGTSDRVKVKTFDFFTEGTYDWVVYVPAFNEPGARSSIGAFLYSPQSSGDFAAREIDFEIGYGSTTTRANMGLTDTNMLVCAMTVQGDTSSGTSFSSYTIPIEAASWYTLRITLTLDVDGDYIARWFIKKEGGVFVESRFPKKCHYGSADTVFAVYASLETLNFIGDFQPTIDKEVFFDSVSVSSAPVDVELELAWNDNFDNEPAGDTINPTNYHVYGLGTLDKGVTSLYAQSPPNSAYIVVELTGLGNFRSILLHDPVPAMDMTDGTLSVQLYYDQYTGTNDLSAGAGIVGFHLYDADGTEAGTAPGDRFAPSTSFGVFTQNVSALTNIILGGSDFILDTSNIVSYALDFFDPIGGEGTNSVVFYIDDFKGEERVVTFSPFVGDVNLSINTPDNNEVLLSWFAGYGASYQAQYAPHLQPTNWVDFGDVVLGDNSTIFMTDLITNSTRMYRVDIIEWLDD